MFPKLSSTLDLPKYFSYCEEPENQRGNGYSTEPTSVLPTAGHKFPPIFREIFGHFFFGILSSLFTAELHLSGLIGTASHPNMH